MLNYNLHLLVIFIINQIHVKMYKLYNKFQVGGHDGDSALNSVEVFNFWSQEWCMVSNMCTGRYELGVGVLNDLLFAVS